MTGRWLTYNQARIRLGVSWAEIKDLVASEALKLVLIGDHWSISEASVLRVLAARGGDDLAETAGEPELPLWIEDEYRRGKDT